MSIKKRRKLTHEIIEDIGVSLLIAAFSFCFLYFMSSSIAERYIENAEISLTEGQQHVMHIWIMSLCVTACAVVFVVLFLFMSGRRTSYLTLIIKEIGNLKNPGEHIDIRLEGNDELTELAESINYMSRMQASMLEREKLMREQREIFVRNLSHDIRTPLTSMISYSQMMCEKDDISKEEAGRYAGLMLRKSAQIRELTDRLLDEGRGKPERIDSVRLLMEQLVYEWAETLEDGFKCETAVKGSADFTASVDVYALRRIMDNLASNVEKYADPAEKVELSAELTACSAESIGRIGKVEIHQENEIRRIEDDDSGVIRPDSRGIGLESVKRLASLYGGSVEISEGGTGFSIDISMYLDFAEDL